jgi:hypothetical protein
VSFAEEAKRFPLAWSDLVKKAKNAAGILYYIPVLPVFENTMFLIRRPTRR